MIRPAATKTRLTLIDDRHEFLDILSERLNRRDHDVTSSGDGEVALCQLAFPRVV